MPPPGYHGCYLRIDVGTGGTQRVALSDCELRHFLGGSGLGTRLLLLEKAARAADGQVKICGVRDPIQKAFRTVGFEGLLEIHRDRAAAVAREVVGSTRVGRPVFSASASSRAR